MGVFFSMLLLAICNSLGRHWPAWWDAQLPCTLFTLILLLCVPQTQSCQFCFQNWLNLSSVSSDLPLNLSSEMVISGLTLSGSGIHFWSVYVFHLHIVISILSRSHFLHLVHVIFKFFEHMWGSQKTKSCLLWGPCVVVQWVKPHLWC